MAEVGAAETGPVQQKPRRIDFRRGAPIRADPVSGYDKPRDPVLEGDKDAVFHPSRKLVPDYYESVQAQAFFRERGKMPKPGFDTSRAGVRTDIERERLPSRKLVDHPISSAELPIEKPRVRSYGPQRNPITEGDPSSVYQPTSIRTQPHMQQSDETYVLFPSHSSGDVVVDSPHVLKPLNRKQHEPAKGAIPGLLKDPPAQKPYGIRTYVDKSKNSSHQDVINYQYSHGICPPQEEILKTTKQVEHIARDDDDYLKRAEMYHLYKARQSSVSQSLSTNEYEGGEDATERGGDA